MAFTGKSTYGAGADLPELVEDVSDIIGIVSPHETPLLDHLGDAKRPARSTLHEWIEDELLPNTSAIDDETVTTGDQVFFAASIEPFQIGDLVRPGNSSEVMLVTDINTTTARLTVTRGYGGTAQTSLADGMSLTVLGNAALEGADAREAPRIMRNSLERRSYAVAVDTAALTSRAGPRAKCAKLYGVRRMK